MSKPVLHGGGKWRSCVGEMEKKSAEMLSGGKKKKKMPIKAVGNGKWRENRSCKVAGMRMHSYERGNRGGI